MKVVGLGRWREVVLLERVGEGLIGALLIVMRSYPFSVCGG
jgi:hypothetical protein